MDQQATTFYELRFRAQYLESKAAAFQDLFVAIMSKAYPEDFFPCRPWGRAGDRKNDGYLKSERTLFQVYAPNEMRMSEAVAKVETDFSEALPYWRDHFNTWVFVHNSHVGLPPDVIAKLLQLERDHPPIKLTHWGFDELLRRFQRLPPEAMLSLYGSPPPAPEVKKPIEVHVFAPLEVVLSNRNRHPNYDDFKNGAYFRPIALLDRVRSLLDTQRLCLITGKPGQGKTSLALAASYDLLVESENNVVFYVSARVQPAYDKWLDQISAMDQPYVTFIIDDCHTAIDATNELVARLPSIRNARLLLISRSFDRSLGGTAEENYTTILASKSVWLWINIEIIRGIVRGALALNPALERPIGALERILARCRGDLHLLTFYIAAWLKAESTVALSDVADTEIFEDVYRRYLARAPFQEAIISIAAISQFEVGVESKWIGDRATVDALRQNAFVETTIIRPYDIPNETLHFFHTTPAQYLLRAAQYKGLLHGSTVDEFVLRELRAYVGTRPQNFFDLFQALYRNDRESMIHNLLSVGDLQKQAIENITKLPVTLSEDMFKSVIGFAISVSKSNATEGAIQATLVLDALQQKLAGSSAEFFVNLKFGSVYMGTVASIISQQFRDWFLPRIQIEEYAARAHYAGLTAIGQFLRYARQVKIPAARLQHFCDGLDSRGIRRTTKRANFVTVMEFVKAVDGATNKLETVVSVANAFDFEVIAKQSHSTTLRSISYFLQVANRIGLPSRRVNAVVRSLDNYKLRDTIRREDLKYLTTFLEHATACGLDPGTLNNLFRKVDFDALGKSKAHIVTAEKFLRSGLKAGLHSDNLRAYLLAQAKWSPELLVLASACNVSETDLVEVASEIPWKEFGASLSQNKRRQSIIQELTFVEAAKFIQRWMAQAFVDGLGLDFLRDGIENYFAPDSLSAIALLLEGKCQQSSKTLISLGLDLSADRFASAFATRPCDRAVKTGEVSQRRLLSDALSRIRANPISVHRQIEAGGLQEWNILGRNLALADMEYLSDQIIPMFETLSEDQIRSRLKVANLYNIAVFCQSFAPNGPFKTCRLNLPADFAVLEVGSKLDRSRLANPALLLFAFRYVERERWCSALATQLHARSDVLEKLIRAATIRNIDFFLWNLWTAVGDAHQRNMGLEPNCISAIADIAKRDGDDHVSLLGLVGTLALARLDCLDEFSSVITPAAARRVVDAAAEKADFTFLRLLGGLRHLQTTSYQEVRRYRSLLAEIPASFEIQCQFEARQELLDWLDGARDVPN